MVIIRNILLILAGIVLVVGLLGWLGLQVQPHSFPAHLDQTPELETIPLPAGLPAPVEHFYRTAYGEDIPVIETVVIREGE